eukprot:m.1076665 g.1076665  ORF g.1076665 m.1076665 type:complete len:288 (+) comp24247_c1_seq6:829-1692(+)
MTGSIERENRQWLMCRTPAGVHILLENLPQTRDFSFRIFLSTISNLVKIGINSRCAVLCTIVLLGFGSISIDNHNDAATRSVGKKGVASLTLLVHSCSATREAICSLSSEAAAMYTGLKLDSPEVVALLKDMKASAPEGVKPVFCHNDLLAGNVMLRESDGDVTLIDFEYGGLNYPDFDIANHFNEWAGGTCEVTNGVPNYNDFPSPEQMRAFVRAYLTTVTELRTKGAAVTDTAVDTMMDSIDFFVKVNHWYWGMWAVNQARNEGCDEFNYILYAQNRIRRYWSTV